MSQFYRGKGCRSRCFWWKTIKSDYTLGKLYKMEPKNVWFGRFFFFQRGDFQVPSWFFGVPCFFRVLSVDMFVLFSAVAIKKHAEDLDTFLSLPTLFWTEHLRLWLRPPISGTQTKKVAFWNGPILSTYRSGEVSHATRLHDWMPWSDKPLLTQCAPISISLTHMTPVQDIWLP